MGVTILALLAIVPLASSAKDKQPKKLILTSKNTLVLDDVIDGSSVPKIIVKARALNKDGSGMLKGRNPILLFVRSPGGEIQTGLELLEALKGLDRPVDTITNFGASMAFQTVQQLGKRYILDSGVLMSHRGRGQLEGEFGGQKPSQMDSRKGLWESRLDEMDQETVSRTNGKQTMASYQKAYASELWVTGKQAVEQGYADELVQVQCDDSLNGVTTHAVNFMGIININYDTDNCPLNTSPMNIRQADIATNKGVKTFQSFLDEGGGFGSSCLTASGTDSDKLCALDTNLSLERINQLTSKFKSQYENIKDRVVPYRM